MLADVWLAQPYKMSTMLAEGWAPSMVAACNACYHVSAVCVGAPGVPTRTHTRAHRGANTQAHAGQGPGIICQRRYTPLADQLHRYPDKQQRMDRLQRYAACQDSARRQPGHHGTRLHLPRACTAARTHRRCLAAAAVALEHSLHTTGSPRIDELGKPVLCDATPWPEELIQAHIGVALQVSTRWPTGHGAWRRVQQLHTQLPLPMCVCCLALPVRRRYGLRAILWTAILLRGTRTTFAPMLTTRSWLPPW